MRRRLLLRLRGLFDRCDVGCEAVIDWVSLSLSFALSLWLLIYISVILLEVSGLMWLYLAGVVIGGCCGGSCKQ